MSWKDEAIKLANTGMSWRRVAKEVGQPKSSVSDFLRKQLKGYVKPKEFGIEVVENSVTSYNIEGCTHLIIGDTQNKPVKKCTLYPPIGI